MRGYYIKWILHKVPVVQDKVHKVYIQVTYLKDQYILAHEDPYVMYRIDIGFVH
jgi:hypothetical protein